MLEDANGNGLADYADTVGISGATVRLLDATNGVVGSVTTVAGGSFSFTGLKPGTYTLVETDPAGHVSTSANQLGVTVASGQVSDGHVFLDARHGSIGSLVWEDLNGNGVQDAGEPGISNVVVRLTDLEGTLISTNVTDAAGAYAFTDIPAGIYFVQVLHPAGYTNTLARAGTDDTTDSDGDEAGWSWPVQVGSGQNRNDVDFGLYRPARLYGYAYQDADNSLTHNTGDGAADGMLVQLWQDGFEIASTNAAADGYYEFAGLAPGTYTVRFTCDTSALTAIPTTGNAATDPARNRAVAVGPDTATATYPLYSGHGVGDDEGEPVNAGFTGTGPSNSGVDLQAFQGADGVYVEFVAYDVEEDGEITLFLLDPDGNPVWYDSCEAKAGGECICRFRVPGLEVGCAYDFVVQDEADQFWEACGVEVKPFSAEMVRMSLAGVTLRFESLPEREYAIQWTRRLGDPWQTVANNVPSQGYRTTVVVPHPDRTSPTGFFRVVLR
ncbi:MAG: SdrD B-like domain-containing protein [Kiritimatiellia bacterium]